MLVGKIENELQREAVKQAFVWSIRNMWIFTTGVAGLAIICVLFIRKEVLSKVHVETITGLKEKVPVVRVE